RVDVLAGEIERRRPVGESGLERQDVPLGGLLRGGLGSGFPIFALPPSFVSAGGGGSSVRSGIGASVQVSRRPESQRPGGPAGVRDDVLPLERERPRREIERDALE